MLLVEQQSECHPVQKCYVGKQCKTCYHREYFRKKSGYYGRERTVVREKPWSQRNLTRHQRSHKKETLKRIYGITLEDYERMVAEQGGKCAICDRPPNRHILGIDHNHATGQIRGLLCNGCNHLLHALENSAWRQTAQKYLERYLN